jgi:hypothetical protein
MIKTNNLFVMAMYLAAYILVLEFVGLPGQIMPPL